MSITAAVIVPHPPLIVPEVGNGKERGIQKTIDSYRKAARFIAAQQPETVLVISPHAAAYADYIHLASGHKMTGDLRMFGGTSAITAVLDEELIAQIEKLCRQVNFPAGTAGEQFSALDHGTYIPLYFINQYYTDYRLVVCSLAGLSREAMYRFGELVQEAATALGRRTAVIASGDLSHKLKESGPYRFAPEGPKLDKALTDIMKTGAVKDFLQVERKLAERGAECGLGSFIIMAGMLHRRTVTPEFLSYEGPFGVGYAVSLFGLSDETNHETVG